VCGVGRAHAEKKGGRWARGKAALRPVLRKDEHTHGKVGLAPCKQTTRGGAGRGGAGREENVGPQRAGQRQGG